MSDCKTGGEHIKSLKDGRTVYLDGQLIGDVTEHSAFRNAVHSAAALYDFQARPDHAGADDLSAEWLEPAHQPRLADAAQL